MTKFARAANNLIVSIVRFKTDFIRIIKALYRFASLYYHVLLQTQIIFLYSFGDVFWAILSMLLPFIFSTVLVTLNLIFKSFRFFMIL